MRAAICPSLLPELRPEWHRNRQAKAKKQRFHAET
jgi:hypothetical protein